MYPEQQLHRRGHGRADQPPRTTPFHHPWGGLTSNLSLRRVPNTHTAKFQAKLPQLWQVGSSSWRCSVRSVSELLKLWV